MKLFCAIYIVMFHRSRIVDDDIDIKALSTGDLGTTLEEDVGDNDPTIAGIIDERPEHVQRLEAYRQEGKWKVISQKEMDERLGHNIGHKTRHDSDSDQSPQRKQRHDSDSDQSPQRKQRHDSDSDQSPPRKQRHDSDSDQSPPRKQRHDSESDQSPPRRQRHNSHSNQSPHGKHSKNLTIQKKKRQYDSDSDASPPRRKRQNSDSDQSPPRKQRKSKSDLSSQRKQIKDFDSDQSPPRRQKRDSDSDQSPPRRQKRGSDSDQSPPRKHKKDKMEQTLSGKKAGLSSAKDMKREAELLKQREDQAFKQIGDDVSGKNAKTVFRKSGKHMKKQEEITPEERARKEKQAAQYKVWGKGLKQAELQEATVEDTLHEMSKPMARYKDDEDLNSMLRDQHRAEDPMAAFINKKKTGSTGKTKAKPVYSGPAPPPNRYNIMPGYRWDGVDRSNGFEKSIFAKISNKKAVDAMAYEWSVQDM
ncbi:hypothetical protein FSP39_025131 [Pinctada imbricata]|uniref:BUD13 homolog n=1 Tax=Pinctada imbricata TaxID=66713 RepID=A0AA88YLA5_PINIB|nr:hypothetical protein FSP39_025131 [Pinctada imbricata]